MAPYIQLNTDLHKKATSEFQKDFFNLMNNAVFGRTIENLYKRIQVDLIGTSAVERLRLLIADPAYISPEIVAGNLTAIHSAKNKLKLNRPCYVWQAILDLNNNLIYEFWYGQSKPNIAQGRSSYKQILIAC